jgi:lysozyme family protein
VTCLQKLLGVHQDGVIGPQTATAARSLNNPAALQRAYATERVLFLCRLIQKDPKKLSFLAGWMLRALSFMP